MEDRQLLSTLGGGESGAWGLANGSLWHYRDNGGWAAIGGGGITAVSVGTGSSGADEAFLQVNGTSMWEYSTSGGWKNLGGSLATMQAGANGVWGISNGSVWHYQDGVGWTNPGGVGVTAISVGTGTNGADEVFAQVGGSAIWEYSASAGWKNLGGSLATMQAGAGGLWGLEGGSLWHYQDGAGWSHIGGGGITSISVGTGSNGADEVFMQVNGTAVWEYSAANGWKNLNFNLSTMEAGNNGLWGLSNGSLWHYVDPTNKTDPHFQDGVGWTNPGGGGITSISLGTTTGGADEVFAQVNGVSIWRYNVASGWINSNGSLSQTGSSAPSMAAQVVMRKHS